MSDSEASDNGGCLSATNSALDRWVCTGCGYVYDPAPGDPPSGVAPGTPFAEVPDDWHCPVCYLAKDAFDPL